MAVATMAVDLIKKIKDESEEEEEEVESGAGSSGGGGGGGGSGKSGRREGTTESTLTVTDGNSKVSSSSVTVTLESGLEWLDNLCGLTPTSRQGQLVYMLIMLLIPLLPIFALITQNVITLNDIIVRKADLIDSDNSVEKSDETARFIANMQQERSIALMLTFLDEDFDAETKKINFDMQSQTLKTDVALENISDWRAPVGVDILRSKLRLQIRIDDFRKLHQERNKSRNNEEIAYDTLQFYTYVTRVLLDDMSAIIRSSNGSSTWRYLVTYKEMWREIFYNYYFVILHLTILHLDI